MSDSTRTVIWIARDPAAEARRFAPLLQGLAALGLAVRWVAPEPDPNGAHDWLSRQWTLDVRLCLCSDSETAWLSELVPTVRQLTWSVPVVWVHDGSPSAPLRTVLDLGFDDIANAADNPGTLSLRLDLRARQGERLTRQERQANELSGRLARGETILKQREEFLSVCAHDLRSPLGLIQSSLSMVLAQLQPESSQLSTLHQELLTRAKRQATQAIALVNDLLDVMALEQGLRPKYELLSLHEFLLEFHKDYRFQAEQKGIQFHYTNPIPTWRVLADSDRIRQLLQNLFINALKFTEPGKNIYLNVNPFQGRRKADPPYPMIIIGLRDEGRGIPQGELQKIFDRFTQVKDYRRAEGRGLGLTVAKQISTLHDGNIWVQSEEGKGSTFFVLFPHVVSSVYAPRSVGKPRRLIVAEPSLDRQVDCFGCLEEWGYEVIFARDGIEAVTRLFHEHADALIVTPELKKIDEKEIALLLEDIPETHAVPVLAIENKPGEAQAASPGRPFDGVVTLPLSRAEFEATLHESRHAAARRGKPRRKAA